MTGHVAVCRITADPLDPSECLAAVTDPACGGIALFAGAVRNDDQGRPVTGLYYEAHPTARDRLAEVCERAASLPDIHRVAVTHRVGALTIGDVAVVVAVAAPHRGEAFETCRWLIDALKHDVPIWKQEQYADGDTAWVDCP